ncbi:MAG: CpaF family protein [Oligoflexia bacterium]|nr:CpaF family protein [Oligoflexia bacterium]
MGVFEDSIDVFLTPIAEFLRDETVSEILMNGPDQIWIERKGKLMRTEARFNSESALQAAMRNIAQSVGRKIDAENPTLDARLPDGSRIHVVIPPAARAGTTVAIRKFSKAEEVTLEKLVSFGSISADAAKFLQICVALGKNMIVSGGTGSGKTTLLNTLGRLIPSHERLLIVEDASELQVKADHVVCFETTAGNFERVGALTIRDLLRSAMRLRPDRIIVGEVRGPEAVDLIAVMNTGHGGSMGTTHANSPSDALVRLECLAMMSETPLPVTALRRQISSAVHLVIQAKRYSDGSRKISHISQTLGVDEHGNYRCQDLFRFVQKGKTAEGKVLGAMEPCGVLPTFMPEIEVNGYVFPRMKFARPAVPGAQTAAAAKPGAATPAAAAPATPPRSSSSGTGSGQGNAA